jgi:segregation and condensation protein B
VQAGVTSEIELGATEIVYPIVVETGIDKAAAVEVIVKPNMETKRIIEALLFAADKPMTVKHLQNVFPELEKPESKDIQVAIDAIIEDYHQRPIELRQVASGYRFQVKKEMSPWISRMFEEKPPRYSRALLETIAIIAYRQPVTRGEIEDIRGVSVSSNIIRTLLDREWIRVIAHKEAPGKPALYGSTRHFLDYFNLTSLEDLPTLQEIQEADFLQESELQPTQDLCEKQETDEHTEASEAVAVEYQE